VLRRYGFWVLIVDPSVAAIDDDDEANTYEDAYKYKIDSLAC
jgi:hypothetical protein